MIDCFDREITREDARRCREMLQSPLMSPFWAYLEDELTRHHNSSVNALTDNPIKDILMGQRSLGAEQAIRSLISKMKHEVEMLQSV